MTTITGEATPQWVARFLDSLSAGNSVRAASRASGVSNSTAYRRRKSDDGFRAAWAAIRPLDGPKARAGRPAAPRGSMKIERFLGELAVTSNVAAAASVAGMATGKIYHLRRTDPEFARQWYAALAEGYDNLEMELLAHLRGGDTEGGDAPKRKFDTAAALRCLAAHRESVAREKGRRTLAEEAATIAAINAKIDALRAQAKEGDAAIRRARKDIAKRTKTSGEA